MSYDSIHKQIPHAVRSVLILMTVSMFYGCTTLEIADIPDQPIKQYKYTTVTDHFSIAVYPFFDEKESKQYFGTYLLDDGILPVLVAIENRSQSSSFIIEKEKCSLGEATAVDDANGLSSSTPSAVVSNVGLGIAIANPIVGFSVYLLAFKGYSESEMIRHNFMKKELQRQSISPGKEVRGVVYFKLPDEFISNPAKRLSLNIGMQELGTNSLETVYIPFNWKGERE